MAYQNYTQPEFKEAINEKRVELLECTDINLAVTTYLRSKKIFAETVIEDIVNSIIFIRNI